jgi:hypothetical protein
MVPQIGVKVMSDKNAPKGKPGRKPRSVSVVNLTVQVTADPKMKSRVENLIDDLPQHGQIVSESNSDTGFSFVIRYPNGPDGRLAKKGILAALRRLKEKGRIGGGVIATNVTTV